MALFYLVLESINAFVGSAYCQYNSYNARSSKPQHTNC